MSKKSMGYLLPAGDAYEPDLQCMILFYPDRKEYRQALFGSLDYLATWLAWERDADKRGQDAAQSWQAAVLATRECIEMGTCENILELLTEIELNTRANCCETVDTTAGVYFTDEVTDGVGDVPQNIIDAGYATGVSDWAGFDDYKCAISHVMVNLMEMSLRDMAPHMNTAGTIVGGIGTVAAIVTIAAVAVTGGTALLLFGVLAATGTIAALYSLINTVTKASIESLADDVVTNHDELVCAIYRADGSTGAVTDLNAKIDELFGAVNALILKNLNIGPRLRALYGGRYDEQDLAENLANAGIDVDDFDCECIIPTTPTDLDIEAVAWDVYTTGVAGDGLHEAGGMSVMLHGSASSSERISTVETHYGPATIPSSPFAWVAHHDGDPAGYDDFGDIYSEWTDDHWRQVGSEMKFTLDKDPAAAGTVYLRNARVLCDAGSGLEWFTAEISFINRSTIRWAYVEGSGYDAYISYVDGARQLTNWIEMKYLARVPD